MIDTRSGTERLLSFIPNETLPAASLLELTCETSKAKAGLLSSGLQKRVAAAWVKPLADLTCGECRVLTGQRLGLQWLARAIATFAADYPRAECDLYPGDLTMAALIAWPDLAKHAPERTAALLAQNFDWLRREAEEEEGDAGIAKVAVSVLDEARNS